MNQRTGQPDRVGSGLSSVGGKVWQGGRAKVRYADVYLWLVLVSAMDAILTWLILQLGGEEVNPLANAILVRGGFLAMVMFKFALIGLFVMICEYIGRHHEQTGRQLAWVAVAIGLLPVVVALSQLVVVYG